MTMSSADEKRNMKADDEDRRKADETLIVIIKFHEVFTGSNRWVDASSKASFINILPFSLRRSLSAKILVSFVRRLFELIN